MAGFSLKNGLDPPGGQVFQVKLICPGALYFESRHTCRVYDFPFYLEKVSIGPAPPVNLDLHLDPLGLVLDLGDAVHIDEECAEHEVVSRIIWPLERDVLFSLC